MPTRRYAFAPVLWATSIGVQVTVALIVIVGPLRPRASSLTRFGEIFSRPEYDILCYIAGCVVIVPFSLAILAVWRKRLTALPPETQERWASSSAAFLAVIAVGSTTLAAGFVRPCATAVAAYSEAPKWYYAGLLLLPATVSTLLAAAMIVSKYPRKTSTAFAVSDALVPFLILGVLFIPDWQTLTGYMYETDGFFHINAFVMSPAWGIAHGGVPGVDFYSQYGLGWAAVLVWLSAVIPLSYATFVILSMVCACLYAGTIYLLLRRVGLSPAWCAVGLVLAIDMGLFVGQGTPHHVIWAYPQSNFMRHILDVLILIMLWLDLHSNRKLWLQLAATAGGISLFLVTDNGVFVLVMLAVYVILRLISAWSRGDHRVVRSGVIQSIACLFTFSGVFLLGALLVGRSAVFNLEFWRGWLRGIVDSGGAQGYGSWPLNDISGPWLILFLSMFCAYLMALCFAVVAALDGAKNRDNILFGCIGAYGLSTLIYFVGRSQVSVLPQVTLPFVLLAVVFGARLCGRLHDFLSRAGEETSARRLAASAVMAASWAILLAATANLLRHTDRVTYANPISFAKGLTYETVLAKNQIWNPFEPETGCLFTAPLQACGIGKTAQQRFREAVDRMSAYARDGRTIAVVSTFDTTYYYGANTRPWNLQIPLFTVHTEERRRLYIDELIERRPDYVFVVGSEPIGYDMFFRDTFNAVESVLKGNYSQETPAPPFNVWRFTPR